MLISNLLARLRMKMSDKETTLDGTFDRLEETSEVAASVEGQPSTDANNLDAPGSTIPELELLRTEMMSLATELETMKAQANDYKDKFLRSQADLQTYRRRVQGDIERSREAGLESALLPVMIVYDDLGRALAVGKDDPEKILPGIQAVREGLERNLDMLGIKKIGEKGETFNPELHEALTMVPLSEGAEAGTIANVFEVGFMKGEKLVRPAKVVVYQ
jgi:molecular chaperone GrpE